MSADYVEVASSGHIDRGEKCPTCERTLLFRVEVGAIPLRVVGSFCGNVECPEFCVESAPEEPKR